MVAIPFADIETVFLDVGNTLISIDFEIVAAELAARGVSCELDDLRRAECAARPGFSRTIAGGADADRTPFQRYTIGVFNHLIGLSTLGTAERTDLAIDVATTLRASRQADVLWRIVMPRVPEALDRLRALGLTMVVVSNSDGTVEKSLESAGLRSHFAHVIDSSTVGYEKPDARIFEHALKQSGARAETTLHAGDLYDVDVLGARGAGLHAVLLDPFDDWTNVDCVRTPDVWALAGLLEHAHDRTRA